ncbi:MAG: hypothetical protein GY786_14020, partial [Proteobacteria bacterium]|nr:hypothetical protein [Pseudomonadota bacterium]
MDTPEEFKPNDSRPNSTFISTDGIGIRNSMDEIVSCCSNEDDNCLAAHEKPGYLLCSYVKSLINTKLGPVPVIKAELGKDDLFSTFYVRCGIRRH